MTFLLHYTVLKLDIISKQITIFDVYAKIRRLFLSLNQYFMNYKCLLKIHNK